jgi:Aspartyl/Asparaginyl beta-hydroxylase
LSARRAPFSVQIASAPHGVGRRRISRIRAELDALLMERVGMPQYHEINEPATEISSSTTGKWKVFMLELLGHRTERNRARCPQTCAALARVPGVLQAFFSVLEPGKSVPLHDGPYVGYLRYHLGIKVPKDRLVNNAVLSGLAAPAYAKKVSARPTRTAAIWFDASLQSKPSQRRGVCQNSLRRSASSGSSRST